MAPLPYVSDRTWVFDAQDLIARFGSEAASEAAALAGRSRNIGNHLHFCRWRQIERLIRVLAEPNAAGRIH